LRELACSAARVQRAAVSGRQRLVVRADASSKPVLCIGEALWDGLPLVRAFTPLTPPPSLLAGRALVVFPPTRRLGKRHNP